MSSHAVQLLLLIAAILLSHGVVGKLSYITTKSGWMSRADPYKKQLVELRNHGNGFALKGDHKLVNSRSKRAANGPEAATPYILEDDRHQYANVHYSGDESDVSIPF